MSDRPDSQSQEYRDRVAYAKLAKMAVDFADLTGEMVRSGLLVEIEVVTACTFNGEEYPLLKTRVSRPISPL